MVEVPKSIPGKLYDIEVVFEVEGSSIRDVQNNSVKVVENFNRDFNFIHITDLHLGSIRNTKDPSYIREAGYWHPNKEKRWLYLQKAIKEVNLLKPDFVIVTGDVVFGQLHPLEYIAEYEEAHQMLQKFEVPIYLTPGNHDCSGWYVYRWRKVLGKLFWPNAVIMGRYKRYTPGTITITPDWFPNTISQDGPKLGRDTINIRKYDGSRMGVYDGNVIKFYTDYAKMLQKLKPSS